MTEGSKLEDSTPPTPKSVAGILKERHPYVPLSILTEPICGTEPRLVLPHPVTLRFHNENSSCLGITYSSIKVTCVSTDLDYFYCQPRTRSMSRKWVLWNMAGTPVVNFKWIDTFPKSLLPISLFSHRPKYVVFPGERSGSGKALFNMKAKNSLFGHGRVSANFMDVCTSGRMRRIVLKWNFFKDFHIMYSGEPKPKGGSGEGSGNASIIAKLYSNPFSRNHFVEVAAEVDIALVVTMCLAAMQEM